MCTCTHTQVKSCQLCFTIDHRKSQCRALLFSDHLSPHALPVKHTQTYKHTNATNTRADAQHSSMQQGVERTFEQTRYRFVCTSCMFALKYAPATSRPRQRPRSLSPPCVCVCAYVCPRSCERKHQARLTRCRTQAFLICSETR